MKKYILGNWKLNKDTKEIKSFFSVFNKHLISNKNIVYGFAPTHLYLSLAYQLKKGQAIIISQDASNKTSGSFTGQISCQQLNDLKIKHAIIGHSESRKYFGYTDQDINQKAIACLQNKITPIICIGESLVQYNKKQTKQVLAKQLKTIFKKIKLVDANKCIVAYEPLWAIGTGKTPTLKQIDNLCLFMKKTFKQMFKASSCHVPFLYGGSVDEHNAQSIIKLKNVDGLLIGGASLCPKKFNKILKEVHIWKRK